MTTAPARSGFAWREARGVFWVFLRIGALSFGGPAATTGLVHSRTVVGLKWLDEKDFLHLLGLVNVLPGPNAVEMAMYIGQRRAGRVGFVLGGLAFILPGAVLAGILAAIYVRYGDTPPVASVLYGVKPVITAVTAWSTVRLAMSTKPGAPQLAAMAGVTVAYLFGVDETVLLALLGLIAFLVHLVRRRRTTRADRLGISLLPVLPLLAAPPRGAGVALTTLGVIFVKAGALLFGGGAVLLAVLHSELVVERAWITQTQLLDAIAIGQTTPGPILNTATFIGYLLGGGPGAVVATVAVLLPSFVLMAAADPALRLIRRSPATRAALDGITIGAIGLIAAVTLDLARDAIVDALTGLLALGAIVVLLRRPQASLMLVAAGAGVGIIRLAAISLLG